ncbi:hypothetical protein BgAZ_103940 [Babesia gibsoni]|uniref:Uncharacterized protein n=1 Tax=Babesia gibsoni TaxID=33632 RepID=A0AAD8PFH2_BABGI|nr:hypothetical protein BgAZ_103940 [Babesia gibsoni]
MVSRVSKDYDFLFKLVLIGDSGVGKSCVLLRFADDAFTDSYITTIGVDFRFRTIEVEGKRIKLQIWDTAGQERFRTITSAYYRGADGIILVYDITDKVSFDHLDMWLSEVEKFAPEGTHTLLLGNKSDEAESRDVATEEVQQFSTKHDIPCMDVSAKTGDNIETAFVSIAKRLLDEKSKNQPEAQKTVPETISLNDRVKGVLNNIPGVNTTCCN